MLNSTGHGISTGLVKTKLRKIKTLIAFKHSDVLYIMVIHVKMPTVVVIFTLVSMINFMLN